MKPNTVYPENLAPVKFGDFCVNNYWPYLNLAITEWVIADGHRY